MQDFFQRYARGSGNALARYDAGDRLVYANPAFCGLFPAAVPGRSGPDLPPGLAERLAREATLAREQGGVREFVWEGDADGLRRRLGGRLVPDPAPRRAAAGGLVLELRELGLVEGLAEQVKAERRARRRAELLRERGRGLFFNVIEELPIFVYMQRRDYSVAYANRKTKNFYGETDGRLCYEVFNGRSSPCPRCPTFRVFETGQPEQWEFTDGNGRTFHIHDYPFEDENGEPLVMEMGIDVTELKRVERELFQAQKMRAIGVLAGGIAHDLNNNLVPIIFNTEFAQGRNADPVLAEPLAESLRAAYRAADLVEQVLEYSRQQDVSRSPLRLTPLVQESLDLLRASMPSSVALEVDYASQQDCVLAHPAQVQQVLLNLCRNAVQAMPEGGRLRVSVANATVDSVKRAPHPGLGLGEYVVLRVADTGCGIEPDKVERIFEPFYTTKKHCGGTGMGLAVVHAIAASTGGTIQVDSVLGRGATFTVYLPTTRPVERQVAAETAIPRGEARRLLLVDDDADALQAMQRVLRDAGFEVSTAGCGEDGLREYLGNRNGFDLILADQTMPDLSGLEMASRILERDAAARVVICTGHVEPRLEAQAQAAGIAGFFMKPMPPRTLVENIRRLCR